MKLVAGHKSFEIEIQLLVIKLIVLLDNWF